MGTSYSSSKPAGQKSSVVRRAGSLAAKYGGLAAIVALETPIHESIHCAAAEVTFGDCNGVVLSPRHWYLKPLEYLTFGFYKVDSIPLGRDGITTMVHGDGFFGNLGHVVSSAAPEFAYTTLGLALVKTGIENWKEQPIKGMVQTLVGGTCLSSTLNYMRVSFFGAQPGHDYYNVTAGVLKMIHLPEQIASVLTPVVGIPLLFAGAYMAAGVVTSLRGKKETTPVIRP